MAVVIHERLAILANGTGKFGGSQCPLDMMRERVTSASRRRRCRTPSRRGEPAIELQLARALG